MPRKTRKTRKTEIQRAATALGRKGGQARSPAKTAANRANARKRWATGTLGSLSGPPTETGVTSYDHADLILHG